MLCFLRDSLCIFILILISVQASLELNNHLEFFLFYETLVDKKETIHWIGLICKFWIKGAEASSTSFRNKKYEVFVEVEQKKKLICN
jgi:hypothetical protein